MTTDIAALRQAIELLEQMPFHAGQSTRPIAFGHLSPVIDAARAHLESLTAPATDDEREEIARIIRDADDKAYAESGWFAALPTGLADAILAAGFRRSARVSVSQDELDGALQEWAGARSLGSHLMARFDIFPKAARKPADSSNGEKHG